MIDFILQPFTAFKQIFSSPSYGEYLEKYILTRNPQDTADVERLTLEWQRGQQREWLR